MQHAYSVYMLASRRNGAFYVGVTNDLVRRVSEHRQGLLPGFTRDYGVKALVCYEVHGDIAEAILREKRTKRWRRAWKLALIEAANPQWKDLWLELFETPPESVAEPLLSPGAALRGACPRERAIATRGPGWQWERMIFCCLVSMGNL